MAKRPAFVAKNTAPFYECVEIEFRYYSGFAISQKQKSIESLHENIRKRYPTRNPLEISTKSPEKLGFVLSAFNLPIQYKETEIKLECAFQGSKVFDNGGPYIDLYFKNPWEVKKDLRIKESGNINYFEYEGEKFSSEPKDFFYNWIYIKALYEHSELLNELDKYSVFTDIEFNPQKSLNCQARSVAIAVGLAQSKLLSEALKDKEKFLETVYGSMDEQMILRFD